ncbi:TKL protein kinase [Phytophthora nicotianae]|uniref:TKL protein kinase n=2 Tax=Phytophthora nicotianae TaxID=4792 RepID=V9DZR2_PHYNI|nr:TKL protein kinase [Phytophthora nicotianae P1569]ETM31817.1 TKL protein kinase [Phytophthora nicotianae]
MLRAPWLGALVLATSGGVSVLADYQTLEIYSDANCKSIPLVVTLEMINTTCSKSDTCSAIEINNSSYYFAERCATDRFEYTSYLFSGAKYLMIDGFQEEGCKSYARSNVFLAAGTCQLASYVGTRSEIATLFNDGSAYMTIYNDSACATEAQTFDLKASIIQEHSCYQGFNKFYTSDHTGILTGSASSSGSNTTETTTSHDSNMTAGSLFGIVVACLAIVILPALLIYWKMRRSKRKEQKRGADANTRARTPDVALAVSDKHENEERYAPEMSPRSDQRSTLSSHTGGSGQVLRSNELKCDPLRSDELRGTPLYRKDERKRRSDELRSGNRLRSDRFRGDSIGRSGRLHTDELRTTPVRGNRMQREDLNNNSIHSDPVRSDRLKNERQRKERQRKERQRGDEPRSDRSDRDRMPSDPVRSDRMRSIELRSHRTPSDPVRSTRPDPKPQPIHAQRLRGPVTADSVCEDDAILSSRIPRDNVFVEDLIGRGGYGEVYKGTYEGRAVAVKMLFPETRKSTRHVTEFLTEVKMMTVMDHPRVVEFIGVSWNNLMDLCVVTEFMAGGDLRAWLSDRADNDSPVGFDFTKVKIATHVVHALAYLHSLSPSVIHRDLKSRNILLSENQDAKLADFGASRERVDRTMTAGVGTSLWIAPEVMMGERYDDKADMFSFGVVLSELDSQQNPYAHAKDKNPTGRKMPETAILQLVAMGKLRVEFSPGALKGVVQLGTACTTIDPTERPSAAEAFRKLQTILAQEAKKAANAK